MRKVEDVMRKVEGAMRKVEGAMRKVEGAMRKIEDAMRKVEGAFASVSSGPRPERSMVCFTGKEIWCDLQGKKYGVYYRERSMVCFTMSFSKDLERKGT